MNAISYRLAEAQEAAALGRALQQLLAATDVEVGIIAELLAKYAARHGRRALGETSAMKRSH